MRRDPALPQELSAADAAPLHRVRRRRLLGLCLGATILLGLLVALYFWPAPPPDLPPGCVDEVTVKLADWRNGQKAATVSSTDVGKIDALLACLRQAEATNDHKCADSGTVLLHRKGGAQLELGILAGHNPAYYELRVYKGGSYTIYRTEREAFLDAMRDLGVPRRDPGVAE